MAFTISIYNAQVDFKILNSKQIELNKLIHSNLSVSYLNDCESVYVFIEYILENHLLSKIKSKHIKSWLERYIGEHFESNKKIIQEYLT
jgi:hypothetical protein